MLSTIWVGRFLSCTERTDQRKDFELILTVKMETRHPVKGQFGSEFPAICNHCGVITAWSRKTWKFCEQFLRIFWKKTRYGKIFKSLFFTVSPIDVDVFKCRKVVWRENCVIYLTKNSAASQTVATVRMAPNISQGQPPTFGSHYSRFHPNRFTFGGVIAERVKTVFFAP